MDYCERQRSQFVRVSGLQNLTQELGLCLYLEMIDVLLRFRLNCIKMYVNYVRELCPCAIIYKLRVKYYSVTLMTMRDIVEAHDNAGATLYRAPEQLRV